MSSPGIPPLRADKFPSPRRWLYRPPPASASRPSLTTTARGNGGVARLFVTAPQAIGNVNTSGGSPLFRSLDGGAHWSAPVRSQLCTGLSGGDTDLGVDSGNNVYQTDLWLGNSCLSVFEDHGASFAAGNPFGSELQPGDDRPWISYDKMHNQLYITYDGLDALHASNTASRIRPAQRSRARRRPGPGSS
jgi:hypothetical protein